MAPELQFFLCWLFCVCWPKSQKWTAILVSSHKFWLTALPVFLLLPLARGTLPGFTHPHPFFLPAEVTCCARPWNDCVIGQAHLPYWTLISFPVHLSWGFPGSSHGKESACRCRRPRFNPCVWKIPWRREWQLTLVSSPGEFRGQRSLAGYSPPDRKGSDTTEWLTTSLFSVRINQCISGRKVPASRRCIGSSREHFWLSQ